MRGNSWTPGRVNLIGEWIDFNGGLVLPAALPLGVSITVTPTYDGRDRVQSAQFDDILTSPLNAPAQGCWADYVFGALQVARREGWLEHGADVSLTSDIPAGAGVSSSAAVTLGALRAIAPEGTDSTRLALLAKDIENSFIGVPCGVMDQMAVAHCAPGQAIALNTRTLEFNRLTLGKGWHFAVLHSGVQRKLADGRYSQRREACLEAATRLGLDWLCDGTDVATLSADLQPIARHVISENQRVQTALGALESNNTVLFGEAMFSSHASLRDDFDVSTPEIDALVDDAMRMGARGARLTGAGFGGCIVVLLPDGSGKVWLDQLLSCHPKAALICEIGAPA